MSENSQMQGVTFLLDVDNTLLDNDRITADLRDHLEQQVGRARAESYWACVSFSFPLFCTFLPLLGKVD